MDDYSSLQNNTRLQDVLWILTTTNYNINLEFYEFSCSTPVNSRMIFYFPAIWIDANNFISSILET